jgi:hypothetical protein
MAVGDVLGNGKIDVVVHGHFGAFNNEAGPMVLYIQNNPDSWTSVTMTNAPDYNTNGTRKGSPSPTWPDTPMANWIW